LSQRSIKLWFCLAAALIAAAAADPILEYASNSGWFGPGDFTDHSNWNVPGVAVIGLVLALVHLVLRTRASLAVAKRLAKNWFQQTSDAVGPNAVRLIPFIFAAQIATLYLMETIEQLVVFGHLFGPTIWLGAPVLISLSGHAVACILITLAAARLMQSCANATLSIVRIVCAFATLALRDAQALICRLQDARTHCLPARFFCPVGERAPPFVTA